MQQSGIPLKIPFVTPKPFLHLNIIIIIIIINFFNKKVVKHNFTNGEENGVQIIVNNNVYTKLLSRNVDI